MKAAPLSSVLWLFAAFQTTQLPEIVGTLNDRLVSDDMMAQMELKPSKDRDLPGVPDADRVFAHRLPQFRPAGASEGLSVAYADTRDGGFLFVDKNADGQLTELERIPYTAGTDYGSSPEVAVDIVPSTLQRTVLPFRCRVLWEDWEGTRRVSLVFTAAFRAEGYAEIAGRRTLVSLPFDAARGTIAIRHGKIGIDADGDGKVDLRGLSGPEAILARGDRVIFRVRDRYVSVESADFGARRFVLREHAGEEYTFIEVRVGAPLPDFEFTDFDGRVRKLSEFRGKYVLLDFWGSWCGPCLADIPSMKTAYERFRSGGFEIIGIDYEHSASAENVRALLKEKNVEWPNATPDSVKDLVEKRFRISGFPTLILLDRNGNVLETASHHLRGNLLMTTLERVIGP